MIKIIYNFMDNMYIMIQKHTQKIIKKKKDEINHQWNSRTSECSMENKRLKK